MLDKDPVAEAQRHWAEHGWADAAEGMAAITAVMRTQQIMQARIDGVLKPLGLTFARYELLMLLLFSSRGSMPMVKLSQRLQVHPTSVTNAVDRLEAAGLVLRKPHPEDARTTLIELTDSGREKADKATAELNAEVFERPGLGPRKVQSLISTLTDLRRGAGDFA